MAKWKCSNCGYIHDGQLNAYFTCPKCGKAACKFSILVETEKKDEKQADEHSDK